MIKYSGCIIGLILAGYGIGHRDGVPLVESVAFGAFLLVLHVFLVVFFFVLALLGLEGFLMSLMSQVLSLFIVLKIEIFFDLLNAFLVLLLNLCDLLRRGLLT